MYNFKDVEAAEAGKYLTPGNWMLTIKEIKFEKPEGKTPFLKVTFARKSGEEMSHKFYVTPKAFGRLQYLHIQFTNSKLEREFGNDNEIGMYFEKVGEAIFKKNLYKKVLVTGTMTESGKVYCDLPYTGFVCPDEVTEWQEGAFEQDSLQWKNHVIKKISNNTSQTNDVMLPSTTAPSLPSNEDFSDLPF